MKPIAMEHCILRRTAWVVLLLSLAGTPARAGVGDYLADRWFDFADIFAARISAAKGGRGAGVMVRGTILAQAGLVYFDGEHVGLDRRAAGHWREKRFHWALGPLAWNEIETRTVKGNAFAKEQSPWTAAGERGIVRNGFYYDDGRQDALAVGVELQPGILPGFELRVNPLQALDFIVGFTTMDVYDDDQPSPAPESQKPESLPEAPVGASLTETAPAVELAPERSDLPAAPSPATESGPMPGDEPLSSDAPR